MSLETMTKLASTTVGSGGVAAVEFLNIPQGYTDLRVVCSTRTSNSNVFGYSYVYFNGSQTQYTASKVLEGTGTSISSYNQTTTYALNDDSVGNSSTSSIFSNGELYISNYSGTQYKSFSFDTVGENNTTTAYSQLIAGLWSNSSPITRITFSTSATSLSGGTPLYMQHTTFTLYGITKAPVKAAKASGGTLEFNGDYAIHTFLASDTFRVTKPIFAECLIVAGGGGGGGRHGGGGGGGGMVEIASVFMPEGSYAAVVGAGAALRTTTGNGYSGSDSSLFANIAYGGGGGGAYVVGDAPNGGSTGGDAYGSLGGTTATRGLIVNGTGATYGNVKMVRYYGGVNGVGGGGAGVGGVQDFANGGAGRQNNIDGKNYYYGGGGGGSAWEGYAGGSPFLIGGLGGGGGGGSAALTISTASNYAGGTGGRNLGGNGKTGTNGSAGESGTGGNGGANTGGGGGGSGQLEDSGYSGYGGGGGSGIVIIRYKV
jgi:hypothetical protein